jgi:hypothetical protein
MMSQTTLSSYDPNWETRWEEANGRVLSLQPGLTDFGPGYGERERTYWAAMHTLYDAYDAQFKTVEAYRDHRLHFHMNLAEGTNVTAPRFPKGADLAQVKALFQRFRDDIDAARRRRAVPSRLSRVKAFFKNITFWPRGGVVRTAAS